MKSPLPNKTKDIDANFLNTISKRIDQHMSATSLLENIRWRFITAFGFGALAAFFLSAYKSFEVNKTIVGIFIYILSSTGIMTQIRIFGLVMTLWKKIRNLQKREFCFLNESKNSTVNMESDFTLPNLEGNKLDFTLTVHRATCTVFSSLIGVSTYMFFELCSPAWLSILFGLSHGGLILYLCVKGTKKYLKYLDAKTDNTGAVELENG